MVPVRARARDLHLHGQAGCAVLLESLWVPELPASGWECWMMDLGLPTLEEEEAERCYRSFEHFAQRAWKVVEPDTPLLWEPHAHAVVAAHVEELVHGFVRVEIYKLAGEHAHRQLPRPASGLLPFSRREREAALKQRARAAHLWAVGQRLEVLLRSGAVEHRPQAFTTLLVNMGTGYGKSKLCSVLAPAYLWLLWPGAVEHSYSVNPGGAAKESRAQLQLVTSEWWRRTFRLWWGLTLSKPAESNFRNTEGGERKASGWGKQVQGDHADFQIIDDPEDPQKVLSHGERESTQKAWDGRISRRVKPGGTAIRLVVQQRLDQEDFSHYLLSTSVPEEVEHLELETEKEAEPSPCQCYTHQQGRTRINWRRTGQGWKDERATGELLAPRLVPPKEVEARKRKRLIWRAQDQQRPERLAGNTFLPEHWWYWRFLDEPDVEALKDRTFVIPASSHDIAEWKRFAAEYFEMGMLSGDLSFGVGPGSAGSADCLGVWGRRGRRRFLLACAWDKMTMTQAREAVRKLLDDFPWIGPKVLERAANASGVADGLTEGASSLGQEAVDGLILQPAVDSKASRAVSIQHYQEAGEVLLPLHHPQRPEMVAEAKAFPGRGRRNDFVDMLSQALAYMRKADMVDAELESLYPRPRR